MADLREIQAAAWAHKKSRGFNTTDVSLESRLLMEEVAETSKAWRMGEPVGPELADCLIFLVSLAQMAGVDLGEETVAKMAVNRSRVYTTLPNGTHVKQEATHA